MKSSQRKLRVALYARVSTGRQAEKDLSIPDQILQMQKWCKDKGYRVVSEFVEPGASGRDENRPVFQEMVAQARGQDRPFDVIVTLHTSRFFRDSTGAKFWKRKLGNAGVKVVAINQEFNNDPMGIFVEGVFELIDEYESNINGFHTLRALKENARQGYYNGSKPKFGFRVVKENG